MSRNSWELNAPANDEDEVPGGRKKRLLKKAPDAPKRFKTAYICFVMDRMDGAKDESPKNEKVRWKFSPMSRSRCDYFIFTWIFCFEYFESFLTFQNGLK